MSQFEVHLQFERGEVERRSQHDAFEGSQAEAQEEIPDLEVRQLEEAGVAPDPSLASFQWSEDRARAIEAAMRRMGDRSEARISQQLGQMIREGFDPQQLDQMQEWLELQLAAWQKRVSLPEEEEERELAETFNLALSQACDGLNLALELVDMLRQGSAAPALAEALLSQVNDYLQNARQFLISSEPWEEPEPDIETGPAARR